MIYCWIMAEITRLNGGSDCMELDFVEREVTPEPLMKLGIRLHLIGLSLSNTIPERGSSVSVGHDRPSIIGYRRLAYSPMKAVVRITSRSTKQ